jgi:Chlorophyll A-B binding protein
VLVGSVLSLPAASLMLCCVLYGLYAEQAPGDLGNFGDFAKPADEDEWTKTQERELKNGRLAMVRCLPFNVLRSVILHCIWHVHIIR